MFKQNHCGSIMSSSTQGLKKQFIGFVGTGAISTAIMYGVYLLLNQWIYYQWSYAISYVISVLALYFMNNFIVFKQPFSLGTFLKFPLIYLLQYAVGAVSLEFLVRFGVSVNLAPILIIILMLPLTFLLNRIVLVSKL